MAALESVPVMRGCSLGYVFFSVLLPGTRIEPHCGASNLRLRCHLPLQLPVAGRAGASPARTHEKNPPIYFILSRSVFHSNARGGRVA